MCGGAIAQRNECSWASNTWISPRIHKKPARICHFSCNLENQKNSLYRPFISESRARRRNSVVFELVPIDMEVSGGIHVEGDGDGDGVVVGEKRKLDSDSVVDDLPDCVMDPRPDKRQQGGVQGEGEEDYGGIVTSDGVVPGQVAPSQHEDDMGDVGVVGAPPSGSKENSKEKRKIYRAARVRASCCFLGPPPPPHSPWQPGCPCLALPFGGRVFLALGMQQGRTKHATMLS